MQTCLIIGASCGIGLETAKTLAMHRCHVVLACRSKQRADEAVQYIKTAKATATVDVVELDLESLTSVKNCCNEFLIKYR